MRISNLLALLLVACAPIGSDTPPPPAPTGGAPGGTPGGEGVPCTQIGCTSGATVSLQVPAALAASPKAVIKACWRDACATGPLPAAGATCQLAGQPAVSSCAVQAGVLTLTITAPSGDVKDGDVYAVEVSDPSGLSAEKAAVQRAVKYTKVEPNGPRCTPVCYQATIQ